MLTTVHTTLTHVSDYLIKQLCSSSVVHKIMQIIMPEASGNVHIGQQNGKKYDLCDRDCGLIVGASWVSISIYVNTNLLVFS